MWKTFLSISLMSLGTLALVGCSGEETKPQNIVCKSTYALCTTAKCTPIEEGQGTVLSLIHI